MVVRELRNEQTGGGCRGIYEVSLSQTTIKESKPHCSSSFGRTHGAPNRGYGYVPLRFGGEGTSLGEWEHSNNAAVYNRQLIY